MIRVDYTIRYYGSYGELFNGSLEFKTRLLLNDWIHEQRGYRNEYFFMHITRAEGRCEISMRQYNHANAVWYYDDNLDRV